MRCCDRDERGDAGRMDRWIERDERVKRKGRQGRQEGGKEWHVRRRGLIRSRTLVCSGPDALGGPSYHTP